MSDGNENPRDRMCRGVVPPDHTEWDRRLSGIEIPTPYLPDCLKEALKNLNFHVGVTSNNDFADDSLIGRQALTLRAKTSAGINIMGRDLISSLTCGVSEKLIGYIFVLAFQLKRPGAQGTGRLFPIEDELAIAADHAVDTLDDSVVDILGARTYPVERGSTEEIARGYAYLAASMLRMFTWPAQNYVKSWVHITEGYMKFYSAPMPISVVVPSLGVLQQIHSHFSHSDLMKNTLYRFLYNANRDGEISSVQKYLYDTHLAHTGMHIFPIAYKICVAMGISPDDLLKVVYTNRFSPQIEGLRAAFKLMQSTGNNYKRMMWKYGRIFDEKVFASLQTKSC